MRILVRMVGSRNGLDVHNTEARVSMFCYERLRNAGVSDVATSPPVVVVWLVMMLVMVLAEYCGHSWC